MKRFRLANLEITAVGDATDRICYVLCPFDPYEELFEQEARKFGVAIAVITGMDWDNDLTPWPAKGEPEGSPDFEGHAPQFLAKLTRQVIPKVEKELNIAPGAERTLLGISLSGLFTLWQWMVCDTFKNIISLSGSFWYEGFAQWIESRPVPKKDGRAYFLLGDKEADAKVKAFQPVRRDTEAITNHLRSVGIDVRFDLTPGNHYQYTDRRIHQALTYMYEGR